MPPRLVEPEPGCPLGAATYYGDKGILMHGSHGAMPELVPADTNFAGPDLWLPRTANNYVDWIDAIKNGTKSNNDFSISAKLINRYDQPYSVIKLIKGTGLTPAEIQRIPAGSRTLDYNLVICWHL